MTKLREIAIDWVDSDSVYMDISAEDVSDIRMDAFIAGFREAQKMAIIRVCRVYNDDFAANVISTMVDPPIPKQRENE